MIGDNSPVTGVIEEDNVIVDFGQYLGKTVSDVKMIDPDFFDQLVREKESDNLAIRRHRDKTFRLYLNPLSSRASI